MAKSPSHSDKAADQAAQIMKRGCYLTQSMMLSRLLQRMYGNGLEAFGVTPQQSSMLTAIVALGGAHPSDLAIELEIERSTVSRNLSILSDRGFIDIEKTPTGRTRRVYASAEGEQVVADFFPAWAGAQSKAEEAIGVERLAIFMEVANELVAMARQPSAT